MKCIVMLLLLQLLAANGWALDGPGRMEFPTKKGVVVFEHGKHVAVVGECKACHETPGEINGFGKNVAHKLCIGCHESQDQPAQGPITCDGCHATR